MVANEVKGSSFDVQMVVLICFVAVVLYVVMVSCLIMRKSAALAEGLLLDVDSKSFVSKIPKEEDTLFYHGTPIESLWNRAKGYSGKIVVHRGKAKLKTEAGKFVEVNRRKYGTFNRGESFEILEKSEDLMFHIDLYSGELNHSINKKD